MSFCSIVTFNYIQTIPITIARQRYPDFTLSLKKKAKNKPYILQENYYTIFLIIYIKDSSLSHKSNNNREDPKFLIGCFYLNAILKISLFIYPSANLIKKKGSSESLVAVLVSDPFSEN